MRRCRRRRVAFLSTAALLALRNEPCGARAVRARFADATRAYFLKNPVNPLVPHAVRQVGRRRLRTVRAHDAALRQARLGHRTRPWSAASACRCTSRPVWERPFCRLSISSARYPHTPRRPQPKLLIVAPMSGHYATLLRGTVEAFLPNHDVYITDWVDARMVPLSEGSFDLDDYIDYVISMLHALGGDTHVIGGVPAFGAGAGRRRAHGGRERPLRAADDDADGRADRHARAPDRREQAGRDSAASTGSAATSSPRCRSRIPASCATSIRASCSSPAS